MAATSPPSSLQGQGSVESGHELSDMAAVVDGTLARGFRWLRFPISLEDFFERETGASRNRHLIIAGLVGLVLYDLFLLSDTTIISDVFKTALLIRLGVITPLAILIMFALYRGLSPAIRESLVAMIALCASVSLIYFTTLSQKPLAAYYHTGLLLTMTFGNIVLRIRFWYATAASLATIVIYVLINPVSPLAAEIQLNAFFILGACAVSTLFANYTLEYDRRHSYLLRLHERIRQSELMAHNVELTKLSQIDPLTGIPNRRELNEYLCQLLQSHLFKTIGIVMLDVDHFKRYNDFYGHPAGDECLRQIAGVLSKSLRHSSDMVARFGGEEFVVVLPDSERQTTWRVAERIRETMMELAIPHAASPISDVVTVSAGIATTNICTNIQEPLKKADAALYQAKAAGRNCVRE